jgi:hypothetical protein
VQRFSDMMDEMCYIVATKHSGSLKACCPHLPMYTLKRIFMNQMHIAPEADAHAAPDDGCC